MKKIKLSLFDLDNTLLSGDSDHLWGQFLVDLGVVDAAVYAEANDRFYAQYQTGDLDIDEFLAFSLKPLSQHSQAQLHEWHLKFMQEVIRPLITDKAHALVQKHRDQGHTLMIITATNRFVTAPIAEEFGIEHLIATNPASEAGKYTGQVDGIPSFQAGKIARLDAWLQSNDFIIEESWFYSDSLNDIPLLKYVDHPCAVDPDAKLRAAATESGWPIISLRN